MLASSSLAMLSARSTIDRIKGSIKLRENRGLWTVYRRKKLKRNTTIHFLQTKLRRELDEHLPFPGSLVLPGDSQQRPRRIWCIDSIANFRHPNRLKKLPFPILRVSYAVPIPYISHLTAPWLAPGGSEMRDHGNEVVPTWIKFWLRTLSSWTMAKETVSFDHGYHESWIQMYTPNCFLFQLYFVDVLNRLFTT